VAQRPPESAKPKGVSGLRSLQMAAEATDPTMEQGLEAPAPGTAASDRGGRAVGNHLHGAWGEGRGGKARGDAGPRKRSRTGSVAVGGGKTSKGRNALGGSPFRDGPKHSEPHDRQQGETDLHGRRGKTVEVVRNHAGGTREGLAVHPRREQSRASDSSIVNDGGAIFGQPQERQSGRKVGPHGSGRDGRVGVKVRRVAPAYLRMRRTSVVGTSWATLPRRKTGHRKVEEGSGEARRRGIDRGYSPRGWPP